MKNKVPLALLEQVIMILIFALTAAFCLQGFVLSDRISRQQEMQTQAVLIAQNTAETLKNTSGDFSKSASHLGGITTEETWIIPYDGSWQPLLSLDTATYILEVTRLNSSNPKLGSAQIQVLNAEDILFEIITAWQED
jgi:hypothetical protein